MKLSQKEAPLTSYKNYIREHSPRTALDWLSLAPELIYIYWLLQTLCHSPYYVTDGWHNIGTDKADFYHENSVNCGRFFLISLAVYILALIISYFVKNGAANLKEDLKELIARYRLSITEWFALGFAASLFISYLLSDYKDVALWGESGWYMGMLPHLIGIAALFVTSKLYRRTFLIPAVVYPATVFVFVLAYLNRLGFTFDRFYSEDGSRLATVGNINWYCSYLVTIVFGFLALYWVKGSAKKKTPGDFAYRFYLFVAFATLMTQSSSSGYLALGAVYLTLLFFSGEDTLKYLTLVRTLIILFAACTLTYLIRLLEMREFTISDTLVDLTTYSLFPVIMLLVMIALAFLIRRCYHGGVSERYSRKWHLCVKWFCIALGVLFLLYLVLVVVNTKMGGAISDRLGLGEHNLLRYTVFWASGRGGTWSAGMMTYSEFPLLRKLFGAGPDCMYIYGKEEGSEILNTFLKDTFHGNRLTNAHNEYLTLLVNEGLFGAITFIGMVWTAIRRYIKSGLKGNTVALVCGFSLLAYSVNNIVSFQQSLSLPLLYLAIGFGENAMRRYENRTR